MNRGVIIGIIIGVIAGGGGLYLAMYSNLIPLSAENNFEDFSDTLTSEHPCKQLLKRQFEIQMNAPMVDGRAVYSTLEQNELEELSEKIQGGACKGVSEEQATTWSKEIISEVAGNP